MSQNTQSKETTEEIIQGSMALLGFVMAIGCFVSGWVGYFLTPTGDVASGIALLFLLAGIIGTPAGIFMAGFALLWIAATDVEKEKLDREGRWREGARLRREDTYRSRSMHGP